MAAVRGTDAPSRRRACPAADLAYPVGPNLPPESHAGCREGVDGDVLIYVDCLSMLTQVIEPRESSRAVAGKWAFASVFPG